MKRQLASVLLAVMTVSCKSGDAPAGEGATSTTPAPAPQAPIAYPDTTAGLEALMKDLVAAATADRARAAELSTSLKLPDVAWFTAHFPAAAAEQLQAEHATIPDLAGFYQAVAGRAAGGVTAAVERYTEPLDQMANTYQSYAIEVMTTKVPLYSVRFGSIHFYNFVYEGGTFRYVGKLKKAKDIPANPNPEMDAQLDALSELRAKDRVVFLETGKLPE